MGNEAKRTAVRWCKPMVARRPDEAHRASTPLELLFDLCFVVAVSQATAGLRQALSEGQLGTGALNYLFVFFAIWWAWMNFSWFASAYDTDDALYRLTTLVQIAGGLVLAAGVTPALQRQDFTVITEGYVIMRLAMVSQWLRAAKSDPPRRSAALVYAGGIAVLQLGWLCRLLLPRSLFLPGFAVLVAAELLVPVVAERVASTTWNARHITERYGCFTLIVLGESVLSATIALQSGIETRQDVVGLLGVAVAGLLIVFSMWWLYFSQPGHEHLTSLRRAMVWGYGHLFIFSAAGAVGAGLGVAVDYDTHHCKLSGVAAGMATTVPVSIYLLAVWLLHTGSRRPRPMRWRFPLVALFVFGASFSPAPVHVTAAALAALVALGVQRSGFASSSQRVAEIARPDE